MAFNTNEDSFDKLVGRFEKATSILKRQMTMQEISRFVGVSPGFLSRYRKPQLYNLTPSAFHSVFESIDKLILEKFKQRWDNKLEEYDLVVISEPTSSNLYNNKLLGLQGIWQGFSWNKRKTQFSNKFENDTPAEYFNMFYLNISETGEVKCYLEKTEMSGTVQFVSPKKIAFDFQSEYRKLVMFAEISLRDDLGTIEDITLAYIDTGDQAIKCGLAIINKIDRSSAMPLSKSLRQEYLEGISPIEISYLMNSQLVADEWNFIS